MKSSKVLSEIRHKNQELLDDKKRPMVVKMGESTWELLYQNDLAREFGDIDTKKHSVFGIKVMFDNSLPYGVTRIYTDLKSADVFPL